MGVAIPLLIKYGIPLLTYGLGHLVGWLHHKRAAANQVAAGK